MNGHILPGTYIAVDYWKVKGLNHYYTYFLTHFHSDHISGLTSSWKREIYCSKFTAYLLQKSHGLPASLIKVTPLNQSIIVSTAHGKTFNVTALEANHCPGAVMFYFEGDFGKILYTGDFRFSCKMKENLGYLRGCIDVLYLDNTFCDPRCTFPPRHVCFDDIVKIVKDHPNCDIVIGVRNLGKEHMLAKLGVAVNEPIFVSSKCLQMSQMLFDTNVFTTAALSKRQGRIRTHPMRDINKWLLRDLQKYKPTIAIIPSAIYSGLGRKNFFTGEHIFVVPYSDHSSYPELVQFVSMLEPAKILPIVSCARLFGSDTSNRTDMSCFNKFLRTDVLSPSAMSQINETNRTQVLQYSTDYCSERDKLISVSDLDKSAVKEMSTLSDRAPLKRKKSTFKKERAKKVPRGITYDEDCIQNKQNESSSMLFEKKEICKVLKDKSQEDEPGQIISGTSDDDNDENQGLELPIIISPEDVCQGSDVLSSKHFRFCKHVSTHDDFGIRTLQVSNFLKDKRCGNITLTCESGLKRSCDQKKCDREEILNNQLTAFSENTSLKCLEQCKKTYPQTANESSSKKTICQKQDQRFYRPLEDIDHSAKYLNVESSTCTSNDNLCMTNIDNECCATNSVSSDAQGAFQKCKEVNEIEIGFASDLMMKIGCNSSHFKCNKVSNVPEKNFSRYDIVAPSCFRKEINSNTEYINVLCNKKAHVHSTSIDQSDPKTSAGKAWFQNSFTPNCTASQAPTIFPHFPSVEFRGLVATSSSNTHKNTEQTKVVSISERNTLSSESECFMNHIEETELKTKLLSRECIKALSETQFSCYCKSVTTSIFAVDRGRKLLEHLEMLRKLHLKRLINGSSSPSRSMPR